MNFTLLDFHFQSISIVITDQFYLFGHDAEKMSHRFFNYQVVITKFQNLPIVYTEGKNLAFPDILSRNVSLADAKLYQLEHKVIPKDIKFQINGKGVNYSVLHQDHKDGTANEDPVAVFWRKCIPQQLNSLLIQVHSSSLNDLDISDVPCLVLEPPTDQ